MDDKVLKLIDRAINEGLSYGEVQSIMSFNGYDELAIDQALSELKKKRPEFVSDVPFTSEQPDSGAFNVPLVDQESAEISESELVPDDLTKADFVNNREPLMNFADQQAQTAQDLNDNLKSADPDPLNFFEKSAKRIGGFLRGSMTPGGLGFGVELGNLNVDIERAKQEKELEQDIEYQKSRRDDRVKANAALNDHFGFDYNLYEEDEQGILRPNPEKRKQVDEYLGGMNAQADFIRNQVGIEDAINAEATRNPLPGFVEAVYDPVSAPILSAMNFGTSTSINLYGTIMDAFGAPERYAGRAKTSIAEGRATAQLRAGLDPKDTRSFTELFQEGEIGKGTVSLGITLAEQLPQIAMTILQPELGLAVGAGSAGTASYMDVRNRLDMTVADKVTSTVVSGAAEYLFEKISMTDIRLARKALGIDEAIDVAAAGAKKTARNKALKELRKQSKMRPFVQTGEQFLSEGLEEVGVELTNGVLAYMISGEVTDPRDVLESFIVGGLMGGGTVAVPQMLASGMNGMASIANMKEFKNVSDEIQSLNTKLKDNMSEYDRQKITDRIVELGQKQRNIAAASMPIYAAMPKEAQETMRQIHKDMNTALNSYYSLSDADAKKNQLNVIRNLIKDKNVMEEEYAGRAVTAAEHSPKNIKLNEEYTEELNDSVEYEDGQVKAENGITKSEASAMSRIFGIVKGKGKAKVVVHNSLRSLMNSDSQAREIFRKSKGKTRGVAYVQTEKGGKKTIHVLSPQAFRLYNQHAGTNRSAGKTYAHEVLHTAISEMLTTDPLAQERLFAEIEKEAAAGNVFAREALKFSEKYSDEKGFDENTRKNETLTEFLALMTRGNNLESLRRDTPKLLDRIKNLINDFLISAGYTDIKIQDDADLFTVAKNLSDAMRLGSTVQFGRDIQQAKVAKAKAKRAKSAPTTTEAPVPIAADIDTEKTIDDVMFTLFNDSYEDAQRIEELDELVKDVFESDQQVAKLVRKTINDESSPVDAIRFIETNDAILIKERLKEQRDYLREAFEKLNSEDMQATKWDLVDALQLYYETIQALIIENEGLMSSLVYEESELTLAVRDFYNSSEDVFGIDFRYADEVDYYPPSNVNGYLGMLQSLVPVYESVINEVSFEDFGSFTYEDIEDGLLSDIYGILVNGEKIEDSLVRAIDLKLGDQSKNAAQQVGFEELVSEVKEFINPLLSEIVDSESTVESFDAAFDIIDTLVRGAVSETPSLIYDIPTFPNDIVYFGDGLMSFKNKSDNSQRTPININDLAKAFKGIKELIANYEIQEVAYQPSSRSVKETDVFTKVLYTALVELKTEGAFEGLSDISSLAVKMFGLNPNQDQGIRTVSLLPPTHDMFDEEFNLNSALAESLNPDNVKMTKATPDQWMAYFSKNKSSSQEAEFINVRAWLDNRYKETGKTIPLAEVQEYVKDNLVSPKVFTPAGHYMWSKAKYNKETGEVTVPVKSYLDEVLTPKIGQKPTADTESLDFLSPSEANQVLQDFIAHNGNPFYTAIGAQATLRQHVEPGILPSGEFDYDNYDFFNEDDFDDSSSSVEIFEDNFGELRVRVNYTSIVYPDTRGDALDFNGSVDFTFADFASFMQEAITNPIMGGYGSDSRVSYDVGTGKLSYTTENGMSYTSDSFYNALTAPNTSETEYDKTFERNYAYKTLRVDQGLTENEAISQALVTYGTRGQKTLGKFGTYSLANKGQDKKPVIINYTEVLVNIPNTLTSKQNRGPYVNPSHFDVDNVVVHLRVGEASTADGKRVLFIDEIQSDWGQAARQRGQGMNPFDSAQADEQKIKQALQGVFDLNEMYSTGLSTITRDIQDALKDGSKLSVQLGSDLWLKGFIESSFSFGGLENFDLYSLGYAFLTDIDQRAEVINEIHPGWMSSSSEILQKNEDALKEIRDLLYPLRKFSDKRKAFTEDPLMESEYWGASGIEARMRRVNDIIVERLTETQQSVLEYISQFGTPQLYQSYQGLGAMAIDQITSEINRYIFEPINKSMQDTLAESILQAESAAVDALTSSGRTLKEGLGIFNSDVKSGNGVPYNPWNQNNRWVNMGIRVATKMAVNGGFDYVAWTPGDIQSKRYGNQPGLEAFYNNALPSITKNEIKRFDKKSKPGVLKIRNRINDITSGSFDVLGYPITDKIKDEFSEGTSSFTLDEDYGTGIPNEIKTNPVSILNALSFADQSEISTNIEFKEGLTKMVHESPNREEIIRKYGLTLSKGPDGLMHYEMNQGLMNYLIDSFELETLVAIKAYPDAIGWYDETVTKAMTVVELMYPEIKNDSDKAAIMKMAIAITSNGLKVKQNFALAVKQYEYFRENGKFNENLAEGTQGGAMTTTFKFINKALDVMSIENFVTFLTTPVKNGDMFYYKVDSKGKKSKHNLTGNYPADYELFGAAVFGPKIGNGFFMNLMGEFQTLTIDRWLTRQFGRLRGDLLIGRNIANTKKADIRFKKAVKALGKRDRNKLSFLNNDLSDTTVKMTGRDGEINWNTIASEISSAATKGSNLDILQSNPKLQELRKAANGLTKYLGGEKEAPSTGRERVFMEDIFRGVQQNLMTKYGISITIADLQAVNWYPEKALYQTFQAKNSISSAKDFTSEEEKPDYFSGASEVAREKGIKQKDIDNAIEQLDFRHESIREAVRNGNEQLGTADQKADLEGVRKAINQVRAGQEVTSTFFHLDEEFNNFTQGSRLGDVEYSSMQPHVVQAKTYLERRMNENPVMELEGPKVIRHPGDIAFLLRHMESESSESTFLVVRDRNNPENYDVTYMTTGTVNSASVDPLKVRQIVTNFQETYGVDVDAEVTLVHNHPSGSLKASPADLQMHRKLLEIFNKEPNVKVGNSVIINLDSGQYVEFDKGQLGSSQTFQSDLLTLQKYEKQTGFKNVKVQNFNRQELFRPRTADKLQIRGSNYVPRFLSHFKVSDTTKLGYIVMNQANEITRIAVLDAAASAEGIGLMIERTVGKYGNNIILFGNDKPALKAVAIASYEGLDAQNVKLLDVVHIEPGGRYKSGSDTGEMPESMRFNQFTLEEVAEESMEGAMSIQESLAVTEMQAEQSPLYRERDIDLPNIDEINDVIQGHKAGKKILDENAPLSPGDLVGGRLNLNLLDAGQKKYGYRMSILSVHKPSNQKGKKYQEHNGVTTFAREKVVRNVDVMTLRNAYFNVNVKGSSEVGAMLHNRFVKKLDPKQIKELYPTAKNKFPLASVDGEYVDTPRENTNFDGVMIKYNPMASHMFMDVTGRPIKFAEEVTLIGDRAYARGKIEYAETAWDLHTVPGMGVEGFVVPTRVTTDPAKIEATHNQMMESGVQFSIDESGYESHNILNDQVLNMRRTAQRFANSLGDSEADIRKKIFDNPKNYINPQNLEAIKGNLEEMSDEDLIMIMTDNALVNLSLNPENGNDNIYVLAAIERINRMQANGEDTADAIEALAKVGTTVGRMLRHFAELKTSTPIGIVQMIESAMGKAGRRMTDAQRQNLMKIAQEFMDAQRALIDHQANFGTMDSAEFTKEFTKLSKDLDNITRTLNKITATLIPKRYGNLFGTFIKGNLMTPVSLVTNVVANIFEQGRFIIQRPIEGAIHFLSFKASRLVSKYMGKDVGVKEYYGREAGVTLLALPYAMKQGALGFAQSIKGMFVKQGETQKIVHTGINPMFAMYAAVSDTRLGDYLKKVFKMDMINTDVLPRTKEGKVKPGDRVKLIIEGMFGIAPDIVFRALAVGDLPFSKFSGAFVVYNEAIKRFGRAAIDTDEFQNFLKYPPQDVVTKMSREGQRATFQEKNTASDAILQFRKIVEGKGTIPGRMMGFLFDSFMPYVKTPANIFVSTMKIAMPGVGAMSAMYNYSQGNHKKGNEDLSMAIVGTMMIKAADLLIAAGAIIGAFTDEDKEEKSLQYAYTGGPMRVNQTAIRRYLLSFNEEDLQFQEGDNWIKIDKAGILGVVMGARATATKGLDHTAKSKKNIWYAPGEDSLFDTQFMINYFNPAMMTGTFKFINSMSFLQGANSLLSLIAGDEEGYEMQRNIDNWFRSVTSVALPNTISALNRANRSHMPIFRNKDVARRMQYILLDKTFNVEGYPARVDMVGRDILQTPEGKNPYYYHMFSVLKGQEVDPHPVIREYHRLMTATGDGSWLPSAPSKLTSYYYSPTKTDLGSETYNEIVSMLGPGEKVKMRFEEKDLVRIQKMYYQDLTKNVEDIMATDRYVEAQDDQKVEMIQGVIADTRKMQYVVSRDRVFGSVKFRNEWYKEFLKLTVEGAKGLKEQLKESEE
jgi:DNA repair protein RadC